MRSLRLAPLAALTLLFSAPSLHAQLVRPPAGDAPGLVAITDRVFAQYNDTHSPGCAVGIARGGSVLLERGYGMADLAGERPITPSTILESGSVAKQFTATAVLLLAKDGKLSLDDDARKYIPELPKYDKVITVRHLLTHTSGLREWSNLVAWQGWARGTRAHTNPDMVRLIAAQQAINYPVGEHYSYTNSGFLLLHAIVERVSGMPFATFARSRIFLPAGMTHTSLRDDFTRLVPGLAQAYRKRPDGYHIDMPLDNVIGAGGLFTTVGDWLQWNEVLTNHALAGGATDALTQRMKLNNGLEIEYALGLTNGSYRGTRQLSHSGSTAGYSTYLARYPDQGNLSIAVMCNVAGANATLFTHQIVDALGNNLTKVTPPDTVTINQADVMQWRGVYEDARWHAVTTLDTVRGVMMSGTTPVRALRDGRFIAGGQLVRFDKDAKGVRTMRFATSDGDSVVATWRAAQAPALSAADLAAFSGQYRSNELGSIMSVAVEGTQLTLSVRDGLAVPLAPTFRDAFDSDAGAVWFTRDARGRVTALHLGDTRVWDLTVPRLPDIRK